MDGVQLRSCDTRNYAGELIIDWENFSHTQVLRIVGFLASESIDQSLTKLGG